MIGGIIMVKQSPYFDMLSPADKVIANEFIEFLYYRNSASELNDETKAAITDALEGKNLHGPFESIEDLIGDLDA